MKLQLSTLSYLMGHCFDALEMLIGGYMSAEEEPKVLQNVRVFP